MMSTFRSSQFQPGLYPQLPAGGQPDPYTAQNGAMQPYNAAGPSQPIQPYHYQQQPQFQTQQQFQQPSNQVGFVGGQGQGGGLFNNALQPALYQPAAGSQLQPAFQGQAQQGSQLQQVQGVNQVQPTLRTTLAPQQLESVSRTEDPRYGPLARAKGKVDRAMRADEEISQDLGYTLSVQTSEPYAGVPGSAAAFRPLRLGNVTPLPDALHRELNFKHQTAKMGLFEDIERAWFTIDNKLFLWDYTDGSDFCRYEQQEDTIQAVGLVRADKSFFEDALTHLLIICTLTKVTVIGLERKPAREINLYDTGIFANAPTPITSIQSTNAGRIFMLGHDKNMYELDYRSEGSWLWPSSPNGRKLVNRSKPEFMTWLPASLSSGGKGGVEGFTVDAAQNRVYTFSTNGEIAWIDVAGTGWVGKSKCSNLRRYMSDRNVISSSAGDAGGDVVKLFAVGTRESRSVCLMALCRNGARGYLSSGNFTPVAVRQSPAQLNATSQSFYSFGTLIAVETDSSSSSSPSKIMTFTLNCGRQTAARENFSNTDAPIHNEFVISDDIPSHIWDVAERPATNPASDGQTELSGDGIVLNPLSRQATTKARQFLILATCGLYSASMPRPVDMLSGEVEVEKDLAINLSRTTFGHIQTAAMAILLGSSPDFKASDLSSAVASVLITSGAPLVRETTAGRNIEYSARHDGLALILSRFLRPIWNRPVTAPDANAPHLQILGVPQKTLLEVQARLEGLRGYMDEYPFPRHQAQGDAKIAWDQEELSLHGMGILITQAIEAISFVLLLADYKISVIISNCDPTLERRLASLSFQALLTSMDGRDIAKQLVKALIELQIGQEQGIDTLSELLQQRCGSFCQPGDGVLHKAEENIRRAESSRDPVERNDLLNESLRLFSKAAGSVAMPRLEDVAKRYRALGFTVGSIELPLRCASELDPQDRATDFVSDGEHPSDPRKALYSARMECYSIVIDALRLFDEALDGATAAGNAGATVQKRDEAYALAIASDDELFHFYLYDWHVRRHLSEQLLEVSLKNFTSGSKLTSQFDTPYIAKFLQITSNGVEERRDLLWKYYARREEYLAAAKALFELATRSSALPLNDRAYYLAQALTAAKSAASIGSDDVEFASSLQERIDVAQVQLEVAQAIDVHPEMTQDEKSEALGRLDRELIGLDELYQGFARPYRLYEPILLILKTADTRIDDVCEAVWRQLLQQASAAGRSQGGSDARVGEAIKELMRRYFPSEAAPLDLVLPVIYTDAAVIGGAPGWATEALLDGGVPLRDLWECVMGLFEESEDQGYYTEEAGVLAERWTHAKDQIPAAEVERFAAAYLLQKNAGDFDERTRRTTERMAAAKAAAGRF